MAQRLPYGALAVTGLGGFLVSLDVSVANSLLPTMSASFGDASRSAVSWVVTAYAISFAAALVPAGAVADRIGRRRTFALGLAVFAAASLWCGLAEELPAEVAARVLQGVGAAAASPAALALLMHSGLPQQRSDLNARWAGLAGLGITTGPLIAALCTDLASWRWAFFINVPLSALACLGALRFTAETDHAREAHFPDGLSALLFAGAAASATYALAEIPDVGLLSLKIAMALVASALLALGFVRRSFRVSVPLIDLRVLASPQTTSITLVTLLYAAGFFGLLYSTVQFLAGPWRVGLLGIGLAHLCLGFIVPTMTLRIGRLPARTGFRAPIVLGCMLMAAGLAAGIALLKGTHFEARYIPIISLIGFGVGFCYPLLGAAAVATTDPAHLGAVSALNQSARQLGAALGIALAVAALGAGHTPTVADAHHAWIVEALCCIAAAAAAMTLSATAGMTADGRRMKERIG